MWWLLIQRGKQWLRMSLVDQQVQLRNLAPLLKFANIKGFMKGITLFRWPWRCTMHSGMMWIVLSGSMPILSTIDDQEVIYPCLFAFIFFKQHVSIDLQCVLASPIKRKIALGGDVCSRPPTIIISHDLYACDIKVVVGEIASYHKKDQLSPHFWFLQVVCFLTFFWPSLLSSM